MGAVCPDEPEDMLHNGHHSGSKAAELPRESALSMGGDSKKGSKPRSVHFSGGGKQVSCTCHFLLAAYCQAVP